MRTLRKQLWRQAGFPWTSKIFPPTRHKELRRQTDFPWTLREEPRTPREEPRMLREEQGTLREEIGTLLEASIHASEARMQHRERVLMKIELCCVGYNSILIAPFLGSCRLILYYLGDAGVACFRKSAKNPYLRLRL